MTKIMDRLQFILGFVMTANLLMINVGTVTLAVSNYILLGMYLLCFMKRKIHISKKNIALFMLSSIFIVSYLVNLNTLYGAWLYNSKQTVIKMGLFILPLALVIDLQNFDEFIRGLKYGCFFQLIWGIAQFLLYEIFGIGLNQVIFGGLYSNISNDTLLKVHNGSIRLTGISWEPANYSLVLNLGYILSNNMYVKILYVLIMLISTSRTGIFVMMSIIIVDWILFKKKTKKTLQIYAVIGIFVVILALVFGIIFEENIEGVIASFSNKSSTSRHFEYYWLIPKIWGTESIIQILFGVGTAAVGKPYTEVANIYPWLSYWNPESDFIFLIIGNGIIGVIIYYYVLIKILIKFKKNRTLFLMLWTILITGFGYICIRSIWPLILIYYLYTKVVYEEKMLN